MQPSPRSLARLCAALLAIAAPSSSFAQAGEAPPIDPSARAAVQQFMATHRAERKRTTPLTEFGQAIRDIRVRLFDVVRNAQATGGESEARLLEAAVQRAQDLLDEASSDGAAGESQHLALVQGRLDTLADRAAAVASATTVGERSQLARTLLEEMEARHARRDRLLGGGVRYPSFRFGDAPESGASR